MSEEEKAEIKRTVEELTGCPVSGDSKFFTDIIDADTKQRGSMADFDVWRFMEELDKRYDIDWTDFEMSAYDNAYGCRHIIADLFLSLFTGRRKVVSRSFTLNHLYEVIEKGKWFNPEH